MTQRIEVQLGCDMGPEEHLPGDDVQTITFSWDGVPLTMELCQDHLEKLEKRLKPFLDQARRAEPPRRTRRGSSGGQDVTHIREWAKGAGYNVGEKGRLPAEIMEAYAAAHEGVTRIGDDGDEIEDPEFKDLEPEEMPA